MSKDMAVIVFTIIFLSDSMVDAKLDFVLYLAKLIRSQYY